MQPEASIRFRFRLCFRLSRNFWRDTRTNDQRADQSNWKPSLQHCYEASCSRRPFDSLQLDPFSHLTLITIELSPRLTLLPLPLPLDQARGRGNRTRDKRGNYVCLSVCIWLNATAIGYRSPLAASSLWRSRGSPSSISGLAL